jgi:T5SS/PEP-CTERM-associated repeat protein/autotransporter-associated beta strand protein
MPRRHLRARTAPTVAAAVLLGLWTAAPAAAQVYTWNDPTTGDWSVGGNWAGSVAPPSDPTTQLVFNGTGTTYTATNDIADPFLLNRLTLSHTGTGGITVNSAGAAPLVFAGADPQLVNAGSGFANVGPPLTLGANTLLTGAGTGIVAFAGPVTDGGSGFGLTVGGSGTFDFGFAGASSINFLRLAAGTTRISNGAWTLTSAGTTAAAGAFVASGSPAGQTADFTLSGGADLSAPNGNVFFGGVAGASATGTITGAGTTVTATSSAVNAGSFVVGESGTATVTISAGAVVNSWNGVVGRLAGSDGTVVVNGAGSQWANTILSVGSLGTGSLTVQNGGQVTVVGGSSIGGAANGSVSVLSGGSISTGATTAVGNNPGSTGTLQVSGTGSQFVTGGVSTLYFGYGGTGNLTIGPGGTVSGPNVTFGFLSGSSSTSVIDAGTLTVQSTFIVGQAGTGGLTVQNGGTVTVAANGFVGVTPTGVGTVTVTGANSRLTMQSATSFLIFGGGSGAGRGDLIVQNGGTVNAAGVQLTFAQDIGSTSVSVVDAGSVSVTGVISLGQSGTGSLTVQNGGSVTAGNVAIGTNASAAGTLTVTGAGSTLFTPGFLRLAGTSTTPGGTATVNVQNSGSVAAGGLLTLYGGATVNVNAGSLTAGGLANGTAASFGNVNLSNGGTLTVSNGMGATYSGVISGAGSFTKAGAGVQTLTSVNTYTGNTNVNAGTLVLNFAGAIPNSPVITVAPGATLDVGGGLAVFTLSDGQALRGGGTVTGGVRAGSGSTVAPGTPAGSGVLTSDGHLTLEPGSTFATRISIGVAGFVHDQLVVPSGIVTVTGSTLTLSGTIPLPPDYVMTAVLNTANNPVVGTFANPPVPGDPLGRLDFGQYAANISYVGSGGTISGGNDIVLYNIVPVPEPTAILAAAVAGLGLAARRRPAGRATA